MPSMSFALSLSGLPRTDLPTMSTPWILHRLYKLDTSSAAFLSHLRSLIRHDGREQCLTNLQGPELGQLVDFLDKVRTLPSTLCPVIKQVLQTLGAISAHDDVYRQCLHKLQAIRVHRATLPHSYIASDNLARVGDHPIAPGEITDAWEGTYRRRRVRIECLKAPPNDEQSLKKVCIRCGPSLSRLLKNACRPYSHFSKRPSSGKG